MFRPLLLSALLFTATAHAEEETRQYPAFYGINVKGPLSVLVEVGKAQSVRVSGRPEYIRRLHSTVEGGVLRVTFEEGDKGVKLNDKDRLTITVPALTSFRVLGAGQSEVRNISGERIDISFEGAGVLRASGKVKLLRMKAQGVGEINTRELKTERADVNFNGMGDVSIHASDTLNLVVQGMGSVKYYGHPKHYNKSLNGLGNVGPGD